MLLRLQPYPQCIVEQNMADFFCFLKKRVPKFIIADQVGEVKA